jgi:hypothetical protein
MKRAILISILLSAIFALLVAAGPVHGQTLLF